jgi:simple sugar transport system permease protein
MTDTRISPPSIGGAPVMPAPAARESFSLVRAWQRISPSLVPVLAVITAMILTVPFMILTGASGDVGRGLGIAGTAYAALIEGSLGLTINEQITRPRLSQFIAIGTSEDLTQRELRALGLDAAAAAALGRAATDRFAAVIDDFTELNDDQLTELGASVNDIAALGADRLLAMRPLIQELAAMRRGDLRRLADPYARKTRLTAADRAELEAVAPSAAALSDAQVLEYMALVASEGIVKLERVERAVDLLLAENIAPDSPNARSLAEAAAVRGGAGAARKAIETYARLDAAGVTDAGRLANEIALVREMYSAGVISENSVRAMIDTQLEPALANNLLVSRPGFRVIAVPGTDAAGVLYNGAVPQVAYARLGDESVLLFFPGSLETMLVRAIPFIIASLAVALAFKAGLFNIGAEGQLYAGGILAVFVGFSPLFDGMPIFIRLPLMITAGIAGGFLWGAIPGALKAYTGAHEVIVTIMLNYTAIRLVDWLIKSTNPVILLDTTASTPRTPFINEAARLPAFASIPVWLFILAGVLMLAVGLYQRRAALRRSLAFATRPVINGLIVTLGGLLLAWVGSRGALHVGFILMLFAVWLTDWFLTRTTLGFELRTVGTNPDAAKYAGMSVPRNTILAMALAGGLAGFAGAIEIGGVQLNMQPEFFSGLGFDAIAVALLARTNPRSTIPAGLLWGSLLAGAGLMQIRADISIDLVKIIQALIIMFIAADTIIRFIYRIPASGEKSSMNTIKSWGG